MDSGLSRSGASGWSCSLWRGRCGWGLRCRSRGGDSSAYDVGIECGERVLRVQVKSTDCRTEYGYLCQFKPDAHSKPYTLKQIDFFAAYVIPEDVWYLIPAKILVGLEGKKALTLLPENPKSPERYAHECYREAWKLLLPRESTGKVQLKTIERLEKFLPREREREEAGTMESAVRCKGPMAAEEKSMVADGLGFARWTAEGGCFYIHQNLDGCVHIKQTLQSCRPINQELDAPEVVFLLLIMNVISLDGDAEGVGLSHGKGPGRLRARGGTYCGCGCDCCGQRLEEGSGGGGGLVGVADQFEQVMIFDVFDLIGEADEAAIDVVEGAAVELVAELFATDGERVTSGVLAEYEPGIWDAD